MREQKEVASELLVDVATAPPANNNHGELLVLLACEGSRATISDEPPLINDLQH